MKKIQLLFNPFERYSETQLLLTGLAGCLFGGITAFLFYARFDGALDFHVVPDQPRLWEPALDIATNICCLLLCFGIIAKLFQKRTRWIDVLAVCLIFKLPIHLLPLTNIGHFSYHSGQALLQAVQDSGTISVESIFSTLMLTGFLLLVLVWAFALLYNGLKTITGLKTPKVVIILIAGTLAAEVLSKIILSSFFF